MKYFISRDRLSFVGPGRQPRSHRRQIWIYAAVSAVAVFAWICTAPAQTPARYPGAAWQELSPSQSGWSSQQLHIARNWSQVIGSAAVVVVQHGAIVASWGETGADLQLNSVRKSLLDALIGIAVADG